MYITVDGIAFTPHGVQAIIKNLRTRNDDLEDRVRRLTAALFRQKEELAAYEDSVHRSVKWRPVNIQHA
jgi:hypothetical protein